MRERMTVKEGILVVIGVLVVVIILGITGWVETHYTLEGIVVGVEDDYVSVADKDGELWGFYTEENDVYFVEGDIVKMSMDDNGTPSNIYDDVIDRIEKVNG